MQPFKKENRKQDQILSKARQTQEHPKMGMHLTCMLRRRKWIWILKILQTHFPWYKLMTMTYMAGLMNQNMILMIQMLKTTRSMITRKRYLKRNHRVTPPMMNQKKMRVPVKIFRTEGFRRQ